MSTKEAGRGTLYAVREVQNYGGFFGGDTVTLLAVAHGDPEGSERTLTIDEQTLANVKERHTIVAGMLLALSFSGERVERAELVGARSHAELRAALGAPAPAGPLDGPRTLSYRCDSCGLWVVGEPDEGRCGVCGSAVEQGL